MSPDTVEQVVCRFSLQEDSRCRVWGQEGYSNGSRVKLVPVQGEPFGSATPGGSMELVIANPDASKVFTDAPLGAVFEVILTRIID